MYQNSEQTPLINSAVSAQKKKKKSSRRVRAAGRDLKCAISRARRDKPTELKPFRPTCTLQIVEKMFKNSCSATGVGLIWQ